jgi:hypothetical protein
MAGRAAGSIVVAQARLPVSEATVPVPTVTSTKALARVTRPRPS